MTNNVSGRVKFDDRGNAVWEWAMATGAFPSEISASARLRKLNNSTLSLADDTPLRERDDGKAKLNPRGTAQGYSPYDSGVLDKSEPPRKKDLRRLSEWMKLRKQAADNKDGD